MPLIVALGILFSFIIILVVLAGMVVLVLGSGPPNLKRFMSEKYFIDPNNGDKSIAFPSLTDAASKQLSVIVPSYNEEERLPVMLHEAMEYLEGRQKSEPGFTYEVIIVDDGSEDKTTEVALDFSEKYGVDKVRVLTFEVNRGKGGAVRMGMLSSRGKLLLFADADGATTFADIAKLEEKIKELCETELDLAVACGSRAHLEKESIAKLDLAVACGSRAHLEKESIAKRSFFRTLLMLGFHSLVWTLCVCSLRDTQCGFKMFTRPAALLLFSNLHIERWAFDVELLHIAERLCVPIGEVAVQWQEVEGSKITPFWSWLQMGRDLILLRFRYAAGLWRMNSKVKDE